MSENQALRSASIFWLPEPQEIPAALRSPPETWDDKTKLMMIRELDRRLVQLWDKVAFERGRGLVDYSRLSVSVTGGGAPPGETPPRDNGHHDASASNANKGGKSA